MILLIKELFFMSNVIPQEIIENRIVLIRSKKVIIDRDIAALYGVSTKRLNEQVKRNSYRFPEDFMFRLNEREKAELVANCDRFKTLKHSVSLPNAFTEHGAIMLASVLNSAMAIKISVQIVRAYVRLRTLLATHKELREKIEKMERTYDGQFKMVFEAIRQLLESPEPSKKKYGFLAERNE